MLPTMSARKVRTKNLARRAVDEEDKREERTREFAETGGRRLNVALPCNSASVYAHDLSVYPALTPLPAIKDHLGSRERRSLAVTCSIPSK